jgi:hypothetical protein
LLILTSNTRVKPSWEQLLKLPHHTKPLKLAVTSNPSIEEEDDAGASSENLPILGGNYENLPHLMPSGDFSMTRTVGARCAPYSVYK